MPPASPPVLPPGRAGFTLIEVLVALVILGLVLGASYQLFSTNAGGVRQADRLARAVVVARSVMAAVGGRVDGTRQFGDVTEDGYRWTVSVDPDDRVAMPESQKRQMLPYRVGITVTWDQGRDYALSYLALGPAVGPR